MEAQDLISIESNDRIEQFNPGDTVKVSIKVREGDRERTQVFQGVVIRKRGSGPGASFTVRRVTYEIGVERTFLINSPVVESVQVVRRGAVSYTHLTLPTKA